MTSWRSVAKILVAEVLCGCVLPPKSAGESESMATSTDPTYTAGTTGMTSLTATSTADAGWGVEADSTGIGLTSSGGQPGVTCRDAVDCLVGCGATVLEELPGCLVQCSHGLSAGESLIMFQLTECVTTVCFEQLPQCEDPGTSTGEPGTSTSSEPAGDPCLDCILTNVDDEQVGGECQELADRCV